MIIFYELSILIYQRIGYRHGQNSYSCIWDNPRYNTKRIFFAGYSI